MFEGYCFYGAHIKKLRIPPSVKYMKNGWCNSLHELNEIEISPDNQHFIFYNNEFLLGKSSDNIEKFDVLHYAQFDIKEAVIPAQVSVIKQRSFNYHKNLKSVKFSPNSELKCIEDYAFADSGITSLSLPASVEVITDNGLANAPNLNEVEVSADNMFLKLIEGKYIVKENNVGSGVFDVIIFGRRDMESITIPHHIKVINNYAFANCRRLETITFEPNSSLESIKNRSFMSTAGMEELVLPPSLREVGEYSLSFIKNVKRIVFLGKSVKIESSCFSACKKLTSITFQNADQITFGNSTLSFTSDDLMIFVKHNAKLSGSGLNDCIRQICYIEDQTDRVKKTTEKVTPKKEENMQNKLEEENINLKKFVSYLRSHLSKYEEVMS